MRTVLVLVSVLAAAAAGAQSPADFERQQKQLLEAQEQAVANAVRPGDENLSCEALQTELIAVAQSPEMRSFAESFGAQAQADLAQVEQAQAAAEEQTRTARRGVFRSMVQGATSAVVPGADRAAARAQQAQAQAQNAELQAQTEQNLQRIAGLSSSVAGMTGPAMRGQRLLELAQARDCAWLKEGGAPGAPPGGLPPGFALPPQPGSAPAPATR